MHVVFRETHGLEESAVPQDLAQSPADLVVLSFSDGDLGAFAAGWTRANEAGSRLPSLRLANLTALQHPLSVDTYVEQTLAGAKGILIRLIGGRSYWSYGLQQVENLAREKGIALAVLAADGRIDTRLDAASTIPLSTLRRLAHLCDTGGAVAAQAALAQFALAAGCYAGPVTGVRAIADVGGWQPHDGVTCPAAFALNARRPRVLVVFYRSYLTAADLHPIEALHAGLTGRGFDVIGLFAPSLKAPDAAGWMGRWVRALRPAAIVNATAFSARGATDTTPLDGANVPVFQIALATSDRAAWAGATRGLSPTDLAMHVVLPEVDGRLFAGVASFKESAARDGDFEYTRREHRADPARITAIAARIEAWTNLASKPVADHRIAIILSTYPGKAYQMAHAVGLDALASTQAILADLTEAGYAIMSDAGDLATSRIHWPLADYRKSLAHLPEALRSDLLETWGDPTEDFTFTAIDHGGALVALQPERGRSAHRAEEYHDLSRCPCHAYVAFYLWLHACDTDALVHVGAHGTLEWLPGKSVALSDACWPEALTGPMPVIYPFIVNDPGEAAQAKRRIGAVTLGHVPPPLELTRTGAGLGRLEALLDEFSNADGLDPARRDRLQRDICDEATATGLAATLGLDDVQSQADAITRIDTFVCDVKESQYGDGLHIYGRGDQGEAERAGLLSALQGKRIASGPSGSPWRGRADVLPTGRNLYTTDPRAVPSRAAHTQGVKLAEEIVRRHLQDQGDYPRTLVVDLWASATMRTAGAEPVWDMQSDRVTGVEILPLANFDRPRIDVTLRVSGLFRDAFPTLCTMFGQAIRALAARDEPADWNPFVGKPSTARVYGPEPGRYGLSMGDAAETYTPEARLEAGQAWLSASSHALDDGHDSFDPTGIRDRIAAADAFVHVQDLPETDLLLAADYAAHEAGFAAAQSVAGGNATLYHLDARNPDHAKARPLQEEIARVVHARAANPAWVDGMMRHGFRGGAEIAATLDHLGAFAHLASAVRPELIDLYYDATLGRDDVHAFLAQANPGALAAMQARFAALHAADLWPTRRNSILARLDLPS